NCKDPVATERFYTRNFGFRRARVIPVGDDQIVFLKTENGDLYLEIFRAAGESPAPSLMKDGPAYPGFCHLAFKVDDVDARLKEMGEDVRITQGPMDFDDVIPGWRTVWIADPDDRIIEISQGYVDQENPPLPGE
ncbi:VOC family protein, partial [Candidatus Pacearchaeota archaeon]|nr:VOC family protein [Candidatus Pacearchaeota archaeon]